jgi:hypothetical protein
MPKKLVCAGVTMQTIIMPDATGKPTSYLLVPTGPVKKAKPATSTKKRKRPASKTANKRKPAAVAAKKPKKPKKKSAVPASVSVAPETVLLEVPSTTA